MELYLLWLMHFPETKRLAYISVAHEQGAAMMADYIQDLGQIFHTMVTSGPGATNLLTGIACSYLTQYHLFTYVDKLTHMNNKMGTKVQPKLDRLAFKNRYCKYFKTYNKIFL